MSIQPRGEDKQDRQEHAPYHFDVDLGLRSYTHPHHHQQQQQQITSAHSYSRTQLDPYLLSDDASRVRQHEQSHTYANASIPSIHGANYGLPGQSTLGSSAFSGLGSPQKKQIVFPPISDVHETQPRNWIQPAQASQIHPRTWGHSAPDYPTFTDNVQNITYVTTHPSNFVPRSSTAFNGPVSEQPQRRRNLFLDEGVYSSKEQNVSLSGDYHAAGNHIRNPPWSEEARFDTAQGPSDFPPEAKLRTAQACDKCRARKAKCNGERPSCARCISRGIPCEYANHRRMRGPNKLKSGKGKSFDNANAITHKAQKSKRGAANLQIYDVPRNSSVEIPRGSDYPRRLAISEPMRSTTKTTKAETSRYMMNSGPHDGAESFPLVLSPHKNEENFQEWIRMERWDASFSESRNSLTIDTQNLGNRKPSSEFDAYSSLNSSCETSPVQSFLKNQPSYDRDMARQPSILSGTTQNQRNYYARQGETGDIATPTNSSSSPVTPVSGDDLSSPESSASWGAAGITESRRERSQIEVEGPVGTCSAGWRSTDRGAGPANMNETRKPKQRESKHGEGQGAER